MGKKVAVAYEDRRKKTKRPVVVPICPACGATKGEHHKPNCKLTEGAECPPVTSGGTYQAKVEACLAKLGRNDPKADVEKSKVYIENAQKAGVDARTTAAIIDATLGHAHLKSPVFTEPPGTSGAAEEASSSLQWHKAPDRFDGVIGARLMAKGNSGTLVLAHQRHGWVVSIGGALLKRPGHDDWPYWPTAEAATWRRVMSAAEESGEGWWRVSYTDYQNVSHVVYVRARNPDEAWRKGMEDAKKKGHPANPTSGRIVPRLEEGAAEESPTRDEWQVIVTNPPAGHRGAILNSVPPGDAYTVGKTIILGGFYDDAEARHVASSITHKYRGSVVTYGPKSTFGVNEAKLGEAWSQYIPYPTTAAEEATEARRGFVKGITGVYGEVNGHVYGVASSISDFAQSPYKLTFYNTEAPKLIWDRVANGWYQSPREAYVAISPYFKGVVGSEAKEECPCPHGGVPDEAPPPGVMAAEDSHPKTEGSICRPFTRVERDPHAFEMCMKRAAEIGPIDNSKAIYELVAPDVGKLDEEHFFVVMMDFRGQLRDYVRVAQGQRHKVHVDVGDVAAAVLLSKCDGYALVHCHPSGNAEPSKADISLTNAIKKSVNIVCNHQVVFVDHVIIGLSSYFSLTDDKLHRVK